MENNRFRRSVLAIAAVAGSMGLAAHAQADTDAPFAVEDLGSGYLLADGHGAEGKCGEGKCGATDEDKADAEGKCGEGKCGAADGPKEGAEGKCGEGKCGGAG